MPPKEHVVWLRQDSLHGEALGGRQTGRGFDPRLDC